MSNETPMGGGEKLERRESKPGNWRGAIGSKKKYFAENAKIKGIFRPAKFFAVTGR